MTPHMNLEVAKQRIAEIHRSAAASRLETAPVKAPEDRAVVALRLAGLDEQAELTDLAALDSQPALVGEVVVAVVNGRMVAAMSLADQRVIADPMVATADARGLLHQRAKQLSRRPRQRRRRLRLRLA